MRIAGIVRRDGVNYVGALVTVDTLTINESDVVTATTRVGEVTTIAGGAFELLEAGLGPWKITAISKDGDYLGSRVLAVGAPVHPMEALSPVVWIDPTIDEAYTFDGVITDEIVSITSISPATAVFAPVTGYNPTYDSVNKVINTIRADADPWKYLQSSTAALSSLIAPVDTDTAQYVFSVYFPTVAQQPNGRMFATSSLVTGSYLDCNLTGNPTDNINLWIANILVHNFPYSASMAVTMRVNWVTKLVDILVNNEAALLDVSFAGATSKTFNALTLGSAFDSYGTGSHSLKRCIVAPYCTPEQFTDLHNYIKS